MNPFTALKKLSPFHLKQGSSVLRYTYSMLPVLFINTAVIVQTQSYFSTGRLSAQTLFRKLCRSGSNFFPLLKRNSVMLHNLHKACVLHFNGKYSNSVHIYVYNCYEKLTTPVHIPVLFSIFFLLVLFITATNCAIFWY
jgi:hypothetical protein